MTSDFDEFDKLPKQRPVFLKVLCMLTFIGSGYGIINSTITYFRANDISSMVVQTQSRMSNDIDQNKQSKHPESIGIIRKVMNNMSIISTPENLRNASMGNIVISLLCLLGAVFMWNLRRIGFYIYALGTIIGIIIPFYLFGNNFFTVISAGFLSFIGILFIIFYAMNIRSMN